MRNIILLSAALSLLASCTTNKTVTVTNTSPTKDILVNKLEKLSANRQFAVGHHDDPVYGHDWKYVDGKSDIKSVTGDYPAIFDWDLAHIEWGDEKNLDAVPFDEIRKYAKMIDKEGGFNTFSWHSRNPRGGNAWAVSNDSALNVVKDCLTLGNPLNDSIKIYISRVADFIGSLRNDNGDRIPVVFRPWHEHTGSWFWWGEKHCTPDQYKALWRLTREIFDKKGIDNVVWAYAPGTENTDEAGYLARYPGDYYVDLVGFDTYCFGDKSALPAYQATLKKALDNLMVVAEKHNKIPIVAETGYEGIPVETWFTETLYPVLAEYPIAYVVLWRNAWDNPRHYYTPYPGHPAAADFKKFKELPKTIFLKDLKQK